MENEKTIERHEIIDNRYEILRQIGEGGSAKTYLVKDLKLERECVMKRVYTGKRGMEEAVEREVSALLKVRHTGVPALNDIVYLEDEVCLIMEYMKGPTLREYMEKNAPLGEGEIIEKGLELVSLVEFLHGLIPPVIHGDIKPENIIIRKEGLSILDFGASILSGASADKNLIIYSEGYSPPEKMRNERPDISWDIYSIGAVLFYMATGMEPSGIRGVFPIREWDPFFSPKLELCIMECCEKDRERRIRSTAEIKRALLKKGRGNRSLGGELLFRPLKSLILTEGE